MSSPDSARAQMRALLEADPGLPRSDATKPYWLHIEHPLASTQSAALPEVTDVAVIGSGITGTSVARSLLQSNAATTKVTVFEARTLCSGATGRNGGNLLSYGGILFSTWKEMHGEDMANKIMDYATQTTMATTDAIKEYAPEESELRPVTRLHTFRSEDLFQQAKESVLECEAARPELKGMYTFLAAEQVSKEHHVHGTAGAILYSGFALWPYRFITNAWERLLKQHSSRLTIETNTPVTNVTYEPTDTSPLSHPYVLHTPRGNVRASRIIHCTNGYSSHLIPGLRGILYPHREEVTVQDLGLPRREAKSWAIVQTPEVDKQTNATTSALLYLSQNQHSGYYFFGGGFNSADERFTADDSRVDATSSAYLQASLRDFLGAQDDGTGSLVSNWTGVLGMTADHAPVIGRLSAACTGRDGDEEWIAAGFNGGGMCICWRAGEAVVHMMRGDGVPEWLPGVFVLSDERLRKSLTVENSVEENYRLLMWGESS